MLRIWWGCCSLKRAPFRARSISNQTRRAAGVPVSFFIGGVFMLSGAGHQARNVTLADGTPFTVVTW